jgi:protein transport protein YIF1
MRFMSPKQDLFCPDLYIPLLAFVTYALLVGFAAGRDGSFSPELLSSVTTFSLVVFVIELLALKGGAFIFAPDATLPWVDCACYAGYKYVGISISYISGLFFGYFIFLVLIAVTGAGMGLFLLRTLWEAFGLSSSILSMSGSSHSKSQSTALIVFSALQILLMYFLPYGSFL